MSLQQPTPPSPPSQSSTSYRRSLANSLRYDPISKELYLQLPSFPEIRVVMYQNERGDEDGLVRLFNSPEMAKRLYRLPYPFPKSRGIEMVESCPRHLADKALSILISANGGKEPLPNTPLHPPNPNPTPQSDSESEPDFLGNPFRFITHSETREFIGDINLRNHSDSPDNSFEPVEEQTWDFGYGLMSHWGGKGIMSEAVGCVLECWVLEWMGIGRVGAYAGASNPASGRVLEKNGLKEVSRAMTDWPVEKGGGVRESVRYERRLR